VVVKAGFESMVGASSACPVVEVPSAAAVVRAVLWARLRAHINHWHRSSLADKAAESIGGIALFFLAGLFGLTAGLLASGLVSHSQSEALERLSSFLFLAAFLAWLVSPLLRRGHVGSIRPRALRHLALTDLQLWSLTILEALTSSVSIPIFGLLVGHFFGILASTGASALWFVPGLYFPFVVISISCSALLDSALEGAFGFPSKRVTIVILGLLAASVGALLLLSRSGSDVEISAGNAIALWRRSFSWLPSSLAARSLVSSLSRPFRPGLATEPIAMLAVQAGIAWWAGSRLTRKLLEDRVFPRGRPRSLKAVANPCSATTTAALVQREVRYLIRTGFGRFTLLMTGLLCGSGSFLYAGLTAQNNPLTRALSLTTAQNMFLTTLLCSLQVLALASNSFGWDGRGAIAFCLGSVSFKRVLLAKNLTTALLAQTIACAGLLITKAAGLSLMDGMVIALSFDVYLLVGLGVFNWISVARPHALLGGRLAAGAGVGSGASIQFLSWIIIGFAMVLPVGWIARIAASNPTTAALLLGTAFAVAAGFYCWALRGCSRRLESGVPTFLATFLGEVA
jgi:hypothetical protein